MSSGRKYVPSFLRNQNGSGGAAGGAGTNVNRFAAFDDDYKAPTAPVATVTSTASVTTTSLKPATLATLTSDSKPKGRSYADRFSEKSRHEDRHSGSKMAVEIKKTDISSEEQFPTLGGAPKKPAGAWGKPTAAIAGGEAKLSTLAQQWAKQKEEEEAAAEVLRLAEEKKRLEEEMMALALKNSIKRGDYGLENPDYSEEDYFHNPYAAQELLADEDSVELPSEDEPSEGEFGDDDEYDENGEHNPNIGYDGRRKDDLY
jgi:hypothetical protein